MDTVEARVEEIGALLTQRQQTVTTIESCTGGGVAHALTAVAGSSRWFNRGVITYSNAAKIEWVGVAADTIAAFGVVSEEVAREMALGGQRRAPADYAIAVTGIAGPGGGSATKPVGMVCFGWALPVAQVATATMRFTGDRRQVRQASVDFALSGLLERLRAGSG